MSEHVAKSCDGDTALSEHIANSCDGDTALSEHVAKVIALAMHGLSPLVMGGRLVHTPDVYW